MSALCFGKKGEDYTINNPQHSKEVFELSKFPDVQIKKCIGGESSFGNLEKWVIVDQSGVQYYVKSNGKDSMECVSECIAYELGLLLGLDVAEYVLDTLFLSDKTIEVCVSKDFSNGRTTIPLAKVFRDMPYMGIDKYNYITSKLSHQDRIELNKMLLFDYIINNVDRHLNNIIFICDDNNNIYLSPIFDNGASLFFNNSNEEIRDSLHNNITHLYSRPFYSNHTKQIEVIPVDTKLFFNKVKITEVYKIVNKYIKDKERAKLICSWLKLKLKEFDLIWK